MNDIILLLFMFSFFGLFFGVVYPVIMIFYYKAVKHSKKSIKTILDEI